MIVHCAEVVDILSDCETVYRVEVLRENPYPFPDLSLVRTLADIIVENFGLSPCGCSETFKDLNGRSLSGAVGTQEGEDLSLREPEGYAVDRNGVAVLLREVVHLTDLVSA